MAQIGKVWGTGSLAEQYPPLNMFTTNKNETAVKMNQLTMHMNTNFTPNTKMTNQISDLK